MAQAGRQPDSAVTVAQLLDQYVLTAGWDVSTRVSNLGYIRRTIKPVLGSTQVRKVRGPLLDTLYVRLMRCGNLACTGKPFTEHRNIPDLRPDPADRRLAAHVEDHPLDYADFQSAIPEGQYGAGTVETWDRGSWAPIGDPDTGMRKGDLQFVLHGKRLQGASIWSG